MKARHPITLPLPSHCILTCQNESSIECVLYIMNSPLFRIFASHQRHLVCQGRPRGSQVGLYRVHIVYISCTYRVHIVYISCTYRVQTILKSQRPSSALTIKVTRHGTFQKFPSTFSIKVKKLPSTVSIKVTRERTFRAHMCVLYRMCSLVNEREDFAERT